VSKGESRVHVVTRLCWGVKVGPDMYVHMHVLRLVSCGARVNLKPSVFSSQHPGTDRIFAHPQRKFQSCATSVSAFYVQLLLGLHIDQLLVSARLPENHNSGRSHVLHVRQGCEFGDHEFYLHLLKHVQIHHVYHQKGTALR
jgi:hypothetical protein